jgi:adenylate cyclase
LAGLQYVEELILSKMKLRVLPQSLKKQHALHVLNLEDNEISEIDDDFFEKLTHLRNINLANNSIKAIPSSFKNCRRIKFINFDHNNLTEFPAAIFDLTRI